MDVKPLITNRFKFDDVRETFQLVQEKHENVIKVLIREARN
jgi:D-xylulose reductase